MECKMRNLVIAIVCFLVALLCIAGMSFAAKAFFIIPMQGGSPNLMSTTSGGSLNLLGVGK
jgi:glucan phosphoethanolaminetransferase (alkaline phosphatase superfamily)